MAKEAEGGKKKGKSKLIVIIAVVALAGVGAKLFLLGGGKAKAATPPPPAKPGPVVDVGDMTINLADQSPRYAAVGMSLELTATGSSDEVTKGIPILKDAALRKLSAHTAASLLAPTGQDEVRSELTAQAQEIFGKDQVMRVLLTQLVVQ